MEQYSKKRISLNEFNNIETKNEIIYELIDGIVLMSPRPNYRHQEIMGNLYLKRQVLQNIYRSRTRV